MTLIAFVSLTKPRGIFKPCMWCGSEVGRIEPAPKIEPANHAGRMICAGCDRQTGWVSARALRQAKRMIPVNSIAGAA